MNRLKAGGERGSERDIETLKSEAERERTVESVDVPDSSRNGRGFSQTADLETETNGPAVAALMVMDGYRP